MKSLNLNEVIAVSGGLNNNQITYVTTLAALAVVNYGANRTLDHFGIDPTAISEVKELVIPALQIVATVVSYKACERVIGPA